MSIIYLSEGAPSHQKSWLLAPVVKNSQSAYENGQHLSDTIAEQVKNGFEAGPSSITPPLQTKCVWW
jgi:hypothetical protein